jgi:hypothetical protein
VGSDLRPAGPAGGPGARARGGKGRDAGAGRPRPRPRPRPRGVRPSPAARRRADTAPARDRQGQRQRPRGAGPGSGGVRRPCRVNGGRRQSGCAVPVCPCPGRCVHLSQPSSAGLPACYRGRERCVGPDEIRSAGPAGDLAETPRAGVSAARRQMMPARACSARSCADAEWHGGMCRGGACLARNASWSAPCGPRRCINAPRWITVATPRISVSPVGNSRADGSPAILIRFCLTDAPIRPLLLAARASLEPACF